MGNRNERTFKVKDISFMVWEDDLFQYVSAVADDEMKLFGAGKALRKVSKWPEVKIGPTKKMPGFYSLIGKRTLVQMKFAQRERDKDIIDAFVVIDFNTAEERFRCVKCQEIFDSSDAGTDHVIWSRDDDAYFIRCPACEAIGISEEQDVPDPEPIGKLEDDEPEEENGTGGVQVGSPGS